MRRPGGRPQPGEARAARSVELSVSAGETIVRVRAYGLLLPGSIQVDSCNVCDPIPSAVWDKRTRDAINRRLATNGHDKGRVLFARHLQFPSRLLEPLAAATIHLGTSTTRILHLGFAHDLVEPQRTLAAGRVIHSLLAVGREHGCTKLEWLHHREEEARACRRRHGFAIVRRSTRRYAGLHENDLLLELPIL